MRSGDYKVSHHVVRTSSPPVSTAVFRFNLSIRVQNKLGCGPASNSAYPRGASSCGIALALTALATCTLSCTVAIISWRLYFKAGARTGGEAKRLCPAGAEGQRKGAMLGCIVNSPGSPVTYRTGIASAPPEAVMSRREFNTVAGLRGRHPSPGRGLRSRRHPRRSPFGTPRIWSIRSLGSPPGSL